MELEEGEKVVIKGRTRTVTATAIEALPRARDRLIEVAKDGSTTTYGDLVRDSDLPYGPLALGRFLDLVAEECERRGEPALDVLVVRKDTGARGGGEDRSAALRQAAYDHWGS